MWFWLSLIALLCWSGSDLFSKIGCQSETDKYSHLKMVTAVGVVFVLAGLAIGNALSRRMNGDVARQVVYIGVGLSGLVTLLQQVI